MPRFKHLALLPLTLAAASAQAAPQNFRSFVAGLHTARPTADLALKPDGPALFEEARTHLLRLYDGITVHQTLADPAGRRVFDCIRYDEQPALRLHTITSIAAPPPFPPDSAPAPEDVLPAHPACASGTFPMERITLDQILAAGGLHEFFHKSPGTEHIPSEGRIVPPNSGGHAYAYAYQQVNNTGGRTTESLYNPTINTAKGEIFSLEQQWYIGGSGTGTQTAEVGWQNYPGLYNTANSVLFAYYTADDYNQTGCYNYSCGKFVKSPKSPIDLAQPFPQYSVAGGTQVKIKIGYTLYKQGWWLSYANKWVGYYPLSVYNGGQLSQYATLAEWGTETVGSNVWPPAGSGEFAARGYPNAAYQAKMSYLDTSGASHVAAITTQQPSPTCFTDSAPGPLRHGLGYGFFLGGPGGTGC